MYSPEVTIVAAGTSALVLGLGLGFHLGKLCGMKLGIAARDFAESFGIGKQGVQAGPHVGAAQGNAQQAVLHTIKSIGGGGGGGSSNIPYSVGGDGSGGYGGVSAVGSKPNWQDLYQNAVASGMSPAAAQQLLINEMAQYRALGHQKKSIP